jgi:hypothetical protein
MGSSLVLSVILSGAKDLTERSDTVRVAGVRSFAPLRTTARLRITERKSAQTIVNGLSVQGRASLDAGPVIAMRRG